jgi:hypothetical protein
MTARLEVSGRTRTSKIESVQVPSSDDPKGLWKGHQDKKLLGWGSPDEEIERLRFQFSKFNSVIYKVFYRLQRIQK